MSKVVSMRFKEAQMERLRRLARRLSRTPSETGALLVEEGLRRNEFGLIDFRDSPAGRQAYIQGSGLAVWEVVELIETYEGDLDGAAGHLMWPVTRLHAALNYADAFPEEIAAARADNREYDEEAVRRMLPGAIVFRVDEAGRAGAADGASAKRKRPGRRGPS
jgi:hypothetical protein